MLSPAHATHSQSRPRRNIHEEIRGRELETLRALGIEWPARNHATHINCPFPDHNDADPSWRWDPRKGHWYCSCDSGSAVDAVMRMHGCDFSAAAKWCRATLFGDRPPPSFTVEDSAAEHEEEKRKKREADETVWRTVQKKAVRLVENPPANPRHPYLARKRVDSHGLLQWGEKLIIPMRDAEHEIWNVQLIGPENPPKKIFLKDGRKIGLAFRIGSGRQQGVYVLAEGYTTAASIYEATGLCTIVTFGKDGMTPIAKSLRAKCPSARLLFAADDDRKPDGRNPGVEAATTAAAAVGGIVVAPDFGPDREEGWKDFNDLACRLGPDAVRAQIMAALDAFAAAPM